jgi:hypothetical protein
MNLNILDANVEPLKKNIDWPLTRETLIRQRLQSLSGMILFANKQRTDFLVVRGAIHDMLSVPEDDLCRTGNIFNQFEGEAVLIVADVHDELLEKFKCLIDSEKVIIMPDDRNKNMSVNDALRMIASVQISEQKKPRS